MKSVKTNDHSSFHAAVIVAVTVSLLSVNTSAALTTNFTYNNEHTAVACDPRRQPAILNDTSAIIEPFMTENGTYELDLQCRWLIESPPDYVVALDFVYFDLDPIFPCADAKLTVYDHNTTADSHYLDRYCGTDTPPRIHSSYRHLTVVFASGSHGEGDGFLANFTFLYIQDGCSKNGDVFEASDWNYGGFYTPGWYNAYPRYSQCWWKISSPNQIRLEFLGFDVTPCPYHNISVYDTDSNTTYNLAHYCGKITPNIYNRNFETQYIPIVPIGSIGGNLAIKFSSSNESGGNGFHARFKTQNATEIGCSGSKPLFMDWSPGLIKSPQSSTSACSWRFITLETRLIRLSAKYFDLPNCTDCSCARLEVYDGETHNSPLIGKYCGSGWEEQEVVFTSEIGFLQYYSTQDLHPHLGFTLEYVFYDVAKHACSNDVPMVLTHDHGLITSPNYDLGDYPNNANCQWLIKTTFGSVLRLDFLDFDVEVCYGECRCDKLLVHNGETPEDSNLIDTYCGKDRPTSILTTQPAVYLIFHSDTYDTYRGFKISFMTVYLPELACGINQPAPMSHETGIILSEGYEKQLDYKPNSDCSWRITSNFNQVVRLTLRDFSLEYSPDCVHDYVEIYDGIDASSQLLGRLCGEVDSQVFESTSVYMMVLFFSNHEIESRGFHLEFSFKGITTGLGLGFLPGLLIALVIVALCLVVATYCQVNNKWRKFRTWLCGLCRRRSHETNEENSGNTNNTAPERNYNADIDFTAMPLRQVVAPPSQVDNLTYYPIADFAPPSYEEAISQQRVTNSQSATDMPRNRNQPASSVNHTTENQNTPQTNRNVASNPSSHASIQNEGTQSNSNPAITTTASSRISYPLYTTAAAADTRLSTVSSPNNALLGSPDMGVGILLQTGIYNQASSRSSESAIRTAAATSSPSTSASHQYGQNNTDAFNPSSSHLQIMQSQTDSRPTNINNITTSRSDVNLRSRNGSTSSFTNASRDSNIFNPVYTALKNRNSAAVNVNVSTDSIIQSDLEDGPGASEYNDIYDHPHELKTSSSIDHVDQLNHSAINKSFETEPSRLGQENKAYSKTSLTNISMMPDGSSNNVSGLNYEPSGPVVDSSNRPVTYDNVTFNRTNSSNWDSVI